jgi:hypothetical protein
MKGNIMTTENTAVTTEEVELTPAQIAENFIKEHSFGDLVDEFVNHYNTIERQKQQLLSREQDVANFRARWASMAETIEEFLKEHISEGNSASLKDLKDLAENLDIELTKELEVTFKVEVTTTLTVPLEFDEDDITEDDFDIRVDYTGRHNDVEEDGTEYEVNDFDSSEK